MTRELRSWALAGLIGVAMTAQGIAAERVLPLSGFSKISAARGIDVVVTTGQDYSVETWASRDRLLRRFDIRVHGDELMISRRSGYSFFLMGMADRYRVTVSLPELDALHASSGAQVSVDQIETEDLTISVSSGASIEVGELDVTAVDIRLSSGADIAAAGRCEAIRVDASSGADFSAEDLSCETAILEASSGSDIELGVSDTLRGQVSSGGHIEVHGEPVIAKLHESSGGDLRLRN